MMHTPIFSVRPKADGFLQMSFASGKMPLRHTRWKPLSSYSQLLSREF